MVDDPGQQALIDQGWQRFEQTAPVTVDSGTIEMSPPVFCRGSGPPLPLMHELPGLAQPCVDFAGRLIGAGYEVFMPQLIGPALSDRLFDNYLRMCAADEVARLRHGESAPITDWLRVLARHIVRLRGQPRVGAIGMCFTSAARL